MQCISITEKFVRKKILLFEKEKLKSSFFFQKNLFFICSIFLTNQIKYESSLLTFLHSRRRNHHFYHRNMITLNNNKPVWFRDNDHGFLLGKITDIASHLITIQLAENKQV
jgi:hypothetical protein